MPSLQIYRQQHSNKHTVSTIGNIQKKNADMIMEQTWDRDIQSKIAYIYDYNHDDSPTMCAGMQYENTTKTEIDIKFIITQYQTISKDDVEYHIQFKPSQKLQFDKQDDLYYYETDYVKRYGSEFPIGLYIDIPNEQGVYERWLICGKESQNQFPKYSVLRCNYYYHWISEDGSKRIKNKIWAVSRSQNSQNSGLWSSDRSTRVENQAKAFFPLNPITEYLYYTHPQSHNNQRLIISALTSNPIVWQISKVENHAPKGLQKITFYQTKFNDNTDFVDFETGEMYADYYSAYSKPAETDNNVSTDVHKYELSTSTNTIKVGGGQKTITANLLDDSKQPVSDIDYETLQWKIYIGDMDVTDSEHISILNTDSKLKIKIKLKSGKQFIQQVMTVECNIGNDKVRLPLTIVAM